MIKVIRERIKGPEVVLILLLLLILAIFLVISWRYNALITITQENNVNLSEANYYYKSESNDTITEYWKKDQIIKINIKQINRDEDTTFWRDSSTGEEYVFYNTTKEYSKNNGGTWSRPSSMTTSFDNFSKFLLAINPRVNIWFENYENKECYYIKISDQEEIIEKETGLLLNTKYDGGERKLSYFFDTVTDADVQIPDISQYTLQENENNIGL